MFRKVFVVPLLFVLALIVFVSYGSGQPGGGGFGKGGKGGKKGGGDPTEFFKRMANGKDYIVLSEMQASGSKMYEPLMQFAKEQGITDGKITQDKFMQYMVQRAATRPPGGPPGTPPGQGGDYKKKGFGPTPPGGPPAVAPVPEKPVERSVLDLQKMAEEEFLKRDLNRDGALNYDEMDAVLKRELIHWDKNQDGVIDQKEFVAYYIEHSQKAERERDRPQSEPSGSSGRIVIELDDLDLRPVVYRAGQLPKELPVWFDKLDANKDGLVSLAEWRQAFQGGDQERTFEKFQAIDRNSDGLLTAEEVLRFQGDDPANQQLAGGNSLAGGGRRGGNNNTQPGAGNQPNPNPFANFFSRGQGQGQGQPGRPGGGGGGFGKKKKGGGGGAPQ